MRLWPVILDCQPPYLHGGTSLAISPLGHSTVGRHLLRQLTEIPLQSPVLVAPRGCASTPYREAVARALPNLRLQTLQDIPALISASELSDALFLIDLRVLVVDARELPRLVEQYTRDVRVTHHLVTIREAVDRTKERVTFDSGGDIRAIRRHYASTTWSRVAGVAATILPIACGSVETPIDFDELGTLRRKMAGRGTPGRDVPLLGAAFDLSEEVGLLAANERLALSSGRDAAHPPGQRPPFGNGLGQHISPSARLIGPVILHRQSVVEAAATIVGPAVIGEGARVGSGAVLGRVVLAPDAIVPPGTTIHDRVWNGVETTANHESPTADATYSTHIRRLITERHGSEGPWAEAPRSPYRTVKRVMDAAIAATALLILSPILTLIGLSIASRRDGPVFYGDEREGLDGRNFRCWKFRTMAPRANAGQGELRTLDLVDGPHFKAANDPRVTPIGVFLRASNLDELPQLWNVVRGDMSLVGPRPSPFRENQVCVPWREARISVRPGITGLWQLCRHDRELGDFHQWIEYDLLYVRHLSFLLDVKILLGTILTLGGKLTHIRPGTLIGDRDPGHVKNSKVA